MPAMYLLLFTQFSGENDIFGIITTVRSVQPSWGNLGFFRFANAGSQLGENLLASDFFPPLLTR